jgi:1-aminocyclopropane-1-carboxylate deaminase/D-cysteine desulfhydrase-like pyridoxal-dependent ACC family enzyme
MPASWLSPFPALVRGLPRVELATLPTAVERLTRVAAGLDVCGLWCKRDDTCARPYGGNKVRKLELLLGATRGAGLGGLLSYGAVGSNHVAATALYARRYGLHTIFLLLPQPPSQLVRRNLLLALASGADLVPYPAGASMRYTGQPTQEQLARYVDQHGAPPAILPIGGTSPLGTIGYVAAAFELRAQVEAGLLPVPDLLYVAAGSLGTAAGLLLGLKAAGLKTRVIAIRVVDAPFVTAEQLLAHARQTRERLHSLDPTFPCPRLTRRDIEFREEFLGRGYGWFTVPAQEAVRRVEESEGLCLDGVYTGKAFAALLADATAGRLRRKTAIFWMTSNSIDFTPEICHADYRSLPAPLHAYFETPLQTLDASTIP